MIPSPTKSSCLIELREIVMILGVGISIFMKKLKYLVSQNEDEPCVYKKISRSTMFLSNVLGR